MALQNESIQTIKDHLIASFNSQTVNTGSIIIKRNNLDTLSSEDLVPVFEAIPRKITGLFLQENGLNNKASAGLAKAFAALPDTLKVLSLSVNWLGDKTGPELAQAFKALNKNLVLLDLNANDLGNMETTQLIEALKALSTIRVLWLGFNNLHNKKGSELAQIFKAFPGSLNTLKLNNNYLGDKPVGELVEAFEALPRGLRSLNLEKNDLGKKSTEELIRIFRALPPSLTELHLGCNGFESKTSKELEELYQVLPPLVRSIHFNGSRLGLKPASELVNLCDSFHGKKFDEVNLSSNNLGLRSGLELAQAFRKIPDTVTSLDLSDNNFNARDGKELEQAFRELLSGLTTINLSRNNLHLFNNVELDRIFRALPSTVHTLKIDKRTINVTEYQQRPELSQESQVPQKCKANEAFRNKQRIKVDQDNFLKRFEPQFLILIEKMEELKSRGCPVAYKSAQRLHDNFIVLKELYEKGTIDEVIFKEDAIEAITTARGELEKHRGWKATLGHIALCILGLGVGYLAYYAYKGSFFKFKTDSGMALDVLESSFDFTEAVSP